MGVRVREVVSLAAAVAIACAAAGGGEGAPSAGAEAVREVLTQALPKRADPPAAADPVAKALNDHVAEMVSRWPLRPLVTPSGRRTVYAFTHPRETFRSVSLALPYLRGPARARAVAMLDEHCRQRPPLSTAHYAMVGRPRRTGGAYDAVTGRGPARYWLGSGRVEPADGLYALWAYCHYADRPAAAGEHWDDVAKAAAGLASDARKLLAARERLLAGGAGKVSWRAGRQDARTVVDLNNALAACVGLWRLARMTGHERQADAAEKALAPLLSLRGRLPLRYRGIYGRVEPVAWYELTPESARWLAKARGREIRAYLDGPPEDPGNRHIWKFSRNNFWHLAHGEGCQLDETALAWPHFPHALFLVRAFIYGDGPAALTRWADMPWCAGDLYWIEKLAITCWARAGRTWEAVGGPVRPGPQ